MTRLRPHLRFLALTFCAVLAVAAFFHFRGLDWLWAKTYVPKAGEGLTPSEGSGEVMLLPVASGLQQPVAVEFVPGSSGRAVVLEKGGKAQLLELGDLTRDAPAVVSPSALVFEISVRTQSEMGLLGIAFHPDYAKNGRFFVNSNPKEGEARTVISEWQLQLSNLGRKRATFVRDLLSIPQPYSNHDGGHLLFGPDGFLYIGMGDGGSGGDPKGHGQNLGTLLGAMLRIDVNGDKRPYGIPKDNPFVGKAGARPEIWAYGLRNPWRYSFDPSNRLLVADVGQNSYEEINVVSTGANMGWNVREARHCFQPASGCKTEGLVDPIFEYGRELGASVTGGVTYTGGRVPSLKGRYLFADFAFGNLWSLRVSSDGKRAEDVRLLGRFQANISSFGRSPEGEVVVADLRTGTIFRLDRAPH